MTTQQTPPPGADLHLGGDAYAHPSLESRLVPITDVTPYPGNPRRGDQDAITASIRDLGMYAGVVVQRSTGHIVVGNHRRHALVALGANRIPVDYLDVDDTRAAAIVARDNRTSDQGGYSDEDLLALLTSEGDVLALSGYEDADLDVIRRAVADLEFTRGAGDTSAGVPVGEVIPPIDLDGDAERVTVTVDAGHRQDLYALLTKQPWVRDVADAHTRKPSA